MLAIFVVAVALTPPDMISPFLLAIPLLALYGLSIGVSYFFRTADPTVSDPRNPRADSQMILNPPVVRQQYRACLGGKA